MILDSLRLESSGSYALRYIAWWKHWFNHILHFYWFLYWGTGDLSITAWSFSRDITKNEKCYHHSSPSFGISFKHFHFVFVVDSHDWNMYSLINSKNRRYWKVWKSISVYMALPNLHFRFTGILAELILEDGFPSEMGNSPKTRK